MTVVGYGRTVACECLDGFEQWDRLVMPRTVRLGLTRHNQHRRVSSSSRSLSLE